MYKLSKLLYSKHSLNILYVPPLLLVLIFIYHPFFKGILYSFTNWNGYSQTFSPVGFDNYLRIFKDHRIIQAIQNTLIYGFGSTILQSIIGLLLAILLVKKLFGNKIARTIVYMPIIISNLIMGYIWYFFFQFNGGAINDVLMLFGFEPVNLLAKGSTAIWIIVLVNTYQYVGSAMVIFMAGLQSIPIEYHEAAKIDGASGLSEFKNITLPLLMPSITISVTLNIIGGLNIFAVIVALTNGGPGYATSSLSTMMYQLYFAEQNAGLAAALGVIMFIMISIFSIISLLALRKKEVEI